MRKELSADFLKSSPFKKFTEEFTSTFKRLPIITKRPWIDSHWKEYEELLKQYGSHVVNKVIYGASIYHNELIQSTKAVSSRLLKVKACISISAWVKSTSLNKICQWML
jgi:hypothetical protein